jgi:hypothetical protein
LRAFLPIVVCLAALPTLFAPPVLLPRGIANAASYEPAASFPSEDATIGLGLLLPPPGYAVHLTIPGIEYATFTQSTNYSQSTTVR